MTDIYHIDNNGEIVFHSVYSLPPKEALKCAVLQFIYKNWNTWNYDKVHVPLKEVRGRFIFNFGDNEAFFTKRPAPLTE